MKQDYTKRLLNRESLIQEMVHNTDRFVSFVKEQDCLLNRLIETKPDREQWQDYIEFYSWTAGARVNIFEVDGTGHQDYQGMNWIDMLIKGKRMRHNLSMLEANPDYYFAHIPIFPQIAYVKINGKTYVDDDGNHRTAIAKALFFFMGVPDLGKVQLHEYTVRYDLKKLADLIQSELQKWGKWLSISVEKKVVERVDAPGWMREKTEFKFVVSNARTAKRLILTEEEVAPFLSEILRYRKSVLKKFLPKNRYTEIL